MAYKIINRLQRLAQDTRAENLVTYTLMAGCLAVAAVYALSQFSSDLRSVLLSQQERLEESVSQPPSSPSNPGRGNCGNPNPGTQGGRSPCAP